MKRLALAAALLLIPAVPAFAEDPPDGGAWADCTVTEVSAFRDRIQIACAGPSKGMAGAADLPRAFAAESRDPIADALLRLAIEAKGRARPLSVLYVKSPGANPEGCAADNCRRVAGVTLK